MCVCLLARLSLLQTMYMCVLGLLLLQEPKGGGCRCCLVSVGSVILVLCLPAFCSNEQRMLPPMLCHAVAVHHAMTNALTDAVTSCCDSMQGPA